VIIKADASQTYTDAVFLQPRMAENRSVLHPMAYFSKTFISTQRRYTTQKRELLAIF
jgi:hypothetical protein